MHDNHGYKLHEIDDIPIKDFNAIFANSTSNGKSKIAKEGALTPEQMLSMF